MARWEEQAIYSDILDDLIMYRRFIDDCILIWKGDEESLIQLFGKLNDNQKNIKLTYEISDNIVHFLDLEIQLDKGVITTKNFFKPVEQNSYIPVDSCHHDPKGQMVHLRKNCTDKSVYLEQAKLMGKKFVSKGYSKNFIEEKIQEVYRIPRESLIQDKEKNTTKYQEIPLIMNYNTQHRQVEHIIRKHWALLKADKQLQSILPEKPCFIYRRSPTLWDLVARNVLN